VTHVAAFVLVAVVVIVTPGPDTALTVRNTLAGGRRSGIFTALGIANGQAIWALATSVGLAAVLATWSQVFGAIKLVGAIYLVALGVQSLVAGLRRPSPDQTSLSAHAGLSRLAPLVAWRQGLVSNLLNPKMVAFFPSLLPQFAADSGGALPTLLALGLGFCAMTLLWLMASAAVLARIGRVFRRSGPRRLLDGVAGAVLIGFGVRLALERR
jgi:threonine/homoserine/homoserine lactone efflux protein